VRENEISLHKWASGIAQLRTLEGTPLMTRDKLWCRK